MSLFKTDNTGVSYALILCKISKRTEKLFSKGNLTPHSEADREQRGDQREEGKVSSLC